MRSLFRYPKKKHAAPLWLVGKEERSLEYQIGSISTQSGTLREALRNITMIDGISLGSKSHKEESDAG